MDVLMPQLGETVAEGKIVKWFKSAGDAVKPGDNLFEIETDKTSMEVPATSAGTLTDIRFQVGETAKVGAVVAVIAGAGDAAKPKAAEVRKARATNSAHPRESGSPGRSKNWIPAFAGMSGRSGYAYPHMDPVPRGAHARAQLRPGQDGERRLHHAAGAAAGRRARHRSFARQRLRPAWPHRRRRCRQGGARARRPLWRRAPVRRKSRRCSRASPTRKCRSTACARPSPSGWSRPSRPSRISISPPISTSAA